jgi:hypothetical protein
MANLILMYNLKSGVSKSDFENWTRDTDYPAMRGLNRVSSFVTHRVEKRLMGEGTPPVQYVEIFEIDDFAGFAAEDMPGATVQGIMGEFMAFVDTPEFLIVSPVE